MALTAKGRATRERIVAGAAAYLRSSDPGDMTLDDVRAVTRTSKGQLFHYFPGGKEELLLEVARHEADRVLDDQQPYLGDLTTWDAWDGWRDALVARYRAQGASCPLGSLMAQVGQTPGAADVVVVLLDRWQQYIADGVRTMQAQHLVRPELEPVAVAEAFVAGIQGGVQMLRSTGSTRHLEATIDTLLLAIRVPAGAPA